MLKKIGKKNIFFCAGPPPPPELHIRIVKQNPNFMYPVHGILFFLQTHVPGYMILCFFFKSMYPGTWNFDFSSNPCTPVHEISLFLCVAYALQMNAGIYGESTFHTCKNDRETLYRGKPQ